MERPKLRRLERLPLRRGSEELLVLRDPLGLCEPFAIDADMGPVLDALDGQRTLAQIRQSLMMRGLALVDAGALAEFVAELGATGLLDDDHFRALWAEAHDAFVALDVRPPRRAGLFYPDDPESLRTWLAPALPLPDSALQAQAGEDFSEGAAGDWGARERASKWGRPPIGIVVPHQPPVGPQLAPALRRLLSTLPEPEHYERIVVLATDHSPGLLPFAACDKDWGTPLGPISADLELLATLDDQVPWLLREQIRLRSADPIEWTTLLLRGLWGDRCPPVLALACGQTRLTTAEGRERGDELFAALGHTLGPASEAGRVLWWATAELSHVGPAFGGPPTEASAVAQDEAETLAPLLEGHPGAFSRRCMDRPASERPSGSAALSALSEFLPVGHRGQVIEHLVLPAPGARPGWIGCPLLRFD